jgi:hypothetical protein
MLFVDLSVIVIAAMVSIEKINDSLCEEALFSFESISLSFSSHNEALLKNNFKLYRVGT